MSRLSTSFAKCVSGSNASSSSVDGIETSTALGFIALGPVGRGFPGETGLKTSADGVSLPRPAARIAANPFRGLRSPFSRSRSPCCCAGVKERPAIFCAASIISGVIVFASCATAASALGISVEPSPTEEKQATKRRRFIVRVIVYLLGVPLGCASRKAQLWQSGSLSLVFSANMRAS